VTYYSLNTGKNTDRIRQTGRNGRQHYKMEQTICAVILAKML